MTRDVTARLAEGRPAVTDTSTYVSACFATGYRHPDLTAHGGQVEEWYAAEDGLDLAALAADCAGLRTAADVADEALRVGRSGLTSLVTAWAGESGSLADDFLQRHLRSGAAVVTALRTAAQTCADLGEALWRLVDGKVGAAVAIDDRRAGERIGWLAAAGQVLGGAGDRSDAVRVVEQQIRPYVDGDIRAEWVAAMRSGTASVSATYQAAVAALEAGPSVHFEVPAHLGPAPAPNRVPAPVPRAAVVAAPAAVPAAPPAPSPVPMSTGAAAPTPSGMPIPPPAVGAALPPPDLLPAAGLPPGGGTLPESGRALPNFPAQLAHALGGLPDAAIAPPETGGGSPGDPVESPDPVEEPDEPADAPERDAEDVETQSGSAEDDPAEPQEVPDVAPEQPAEPQPESAPQPDPGPVPQPTAEAPPPPEEPVGEATPCEIAAGELPQVGQ